jgi:CheY-like chemotaxis protein
MRATAGSRAVLVAEDNAISRELLLYQLQLLDCQAVACEDGQRAVEAWRRGGFALLLTDLQMPGLDGFALAAVIRAEERSGHMPIVALTAGGPDIDAARCLAAGMDGCLTKPVSLAALRRTIARWLPPPAAAATPIDEAPV